ncbi:TnsA endonuclease N-terminal domain-containing protein [Pseudoalteromonas sp. MMG022]|uniref:TnsA endonuclease N-terminal domain-containing protein n=1 Tax=Pseudoalteromonas sp. MMG022 TaxID=2909978 RepID=UPI0023B2082E|nr:TnsA endonuclease N-terminal domain-containing protein [Pseudoalteromonas sp. MMG022]
MCLVESSLEYDACFHFEYSPKIKCFEAQPLGFMYEFEGKSNRYTPDFLLTNTSNKQQLIEIKPKYKTESSDFIARFSQKRKTAREDLGIDLVLVTDAQICIEPMLDNLKLLHQYAGYQALTELQLTILNLLARYKKLRVGELTQLIKVTVGDIFSSICRLLTLGKISSDLSSKLSLDSLVWRDE